MPSPTPVPQFTGVYALAVAACKTDGSGGFAETTNFGRGWVVVQQDGRVTGSLNQSNPPAGELGSISGSVVGQTLQITKFSYSFSATHVGLIFLTGVGTGTVVSDKITGTFDADYHMQSDFGGAVRDCHGMQMPFTFLKQ